MIIVADEDIVFHHAHFQLDPRKAEAKVMVNPYGLGVDLLCDDGSVSFTVSFTPAYIDLLRELIEELEKV